MSKSQTPEPGAERTLRSSVRNPRRRQRQSDGDSLKSAPRRKRSKLSEDIFIPPAHDEEVNGTVEAAITNGEVQHTLAKQGRGRVRKETPPAPEPTPEANKMPMRAKKNSVKRPMRGDGATVLTQNDRYAVKLLPSTPKELRKQGLEYRGSLGAAHHALAVTRERAYIWDYTSHTTVISPLVFDVPFAVRAGEPLPFGALVSSASSADIGLVLVCATTGKVAFYESIERAASLGLFHGRNTGVEGPSCTLFSGETVSDLIDAEHAGFIIVLSSGRIAQLTLRDSQGKARVFAQFLRAISEVSGGILGSIKGLLGAGAWKRDVAAVHTRSLGTKGQMQVISMTEQAELQIWDFEWSGQCSFRKTVDFREIVIEELRKVEEAEMQSRLERATMVDFAILDKATSMNEVATLGSELPLDILVLLRTGAVGDEAYMLVEISLEGIGANVTQVLDINSYQAGSANSERKPKLLLPKPGHTPVIVFEDAMVVVSMAGPDIESPDAQLQSSYVQPSTFQDAVYLKPGAGLAILDVSEECRGGQESGIAFVKNAGLVRISVVDPATTGQESNIPVKVRIEQAVFHGALQTGNVLDFSRRTDGMYSLREVEAAAITISGEILRSTSPFVSTSPTSMENHLVMKAQALRALVTHIRQSYSGLSKTTMWRLLWDAEKVAAGQQMWKAFEDHVAAASKKKRTATVFDEVCAQVQERLDESNNDVVRDFFIHGLHRIEKILPMTNNLLREMKKDIEKSPEVKLRLVVEADEIWLKALETVFTFRAENAAVYGISPGLMEDGVLKHATDYTDLPEFWTSTEAMLKSVVSMAVISRELANDIYEKIEPSEQVAAVVEPMIRDVGRENPRLVQLFCLVYQERINWLTSRGLEDDHRMAALLQDNYLKTRHINFRAQANIAQTEAGLKLAEKYRDMGTLTEMIVAEMQFGIEELPSADEGKRVAIVTYLKEITVRIGKYFERFGDEWANAYFNEGFSGRHAGVMLRDAQLHWQDALTTYLRAEPNRAKICWINDITTSGDFEHASRELALAATEQESRLWNKKIELSMSKLALAAAREALPENSTDTAVPLRDAAMPQKELDIVHVQEQLYQHIYPELLHCIDEYAEIEVSMQKFGTKNQDLHSLRQVLEQNWEKVLRHEALSAPELIDVLTLMDNVISDDTDENLQGQEFVLALQVLAAAAPTMPQDRFETLLQLIWKRCYVYDDWVAINSVQKQSDQDVNELLKDTAPWRTVFYAKDVGLFESSDSPVRQLLPSECIGAGCSPRDLSWRFDEPDLLDPILHDNKIHDEQLQGYVTDRQLDAWIEAVTEDVKRTLEERGEESALALQQQRDFDASLTSEAGVNGTVNKMNGHARGANGIKIEGDIATDEEGVEGSEDVIIA